MLCFRKIPVAENIMYKMGGLSIFSVEDFGITTPKTFATESFCVVFQKTSGSEKDYGQEWGIKNFRRKSFVLQCQKIS